MDDRKLAALLATVRTGSFSQAAKELNCTQSAVTQTMNSIEDELGCKLLERSHSGTRLTAAGEKLLPYIVDAEKSLGRLADQAKKVAEGRENPIRIGTFSSISHTWLPKILQKYQEMYPEVLFDIRVGTDTVTGWLLNGEVDLILGDEERCHASRWYPLLKDPFYAVLPASYVKGESNYITQEEFARYPFIMSSMNYMDKRMKIVSERQIIVRSDDDSTLLSMVEQELGVTAMPLLSLWNIPDNVRIMELRPVPNRILGMGLANSPSAAVKKFAEFLREEYGYGISI